MDGGRGGGGRAVGDAAHGEQGFPGVEFEALGCRRRLRRRGKAADAESAQLLLDFGPHTQLAVHLHEVAGAVGAESVHDGDEGAALTCQDRGVRKRDNV